MDSLIKLVEYFEQFYDSLQDAVCISDRYGKIIFINKAYSLLTDIPKDKMVGKNVKCLVKDGYFDSTLNEQVVRNGEKSAMIQKLYNGMVLLLDGHPVKDANGEVVYVMTTIRDITALSQLYEIVATQKKLLETFQNKTGQPESIESIQYPHVVQSSSMQKIYSSAAKIAETDATLLLLGETGTGKDVLARHIHQVSKRSKCPFIKVDCGSIPSNLIESELFGYESGSFSGASKQGKTGLIEAANSGTLFLDEIGELPLSMQSRLLRVLQDREIMRIGAVRTRKIDVRVIAATNRNLEEEMEKGNFRADLYYRLKVMLLHIPPLRKRKADIIPLAQVFLNYYCKKYNLEAKLSDAALNMLHDYPWPGNIRELENVIQYALITTKNKIIGPSHLLGIDPGRLCLPKKFSDEIDIEFKSTSLKEMMKDVEVYLLKKGLKKYGSVNELAKQFKVNRTTIFRKLHKQ